MTDDSVRTAHPFFAERSLWARGLALALMLCAPATAIAQSSEEALLERGADLREQGNDVDALAVFQQAYEQSRSPRALAQIGLAEQALGSWIEAEAHVASALEQRRDPWIRRHAPALRGALETIRAHLGTLELIGGVRGAEVTVNGGVVGALPLAPTRVVAGSVVVTVTAPEHHPWSRTVVIRGGAVTREQVELVHRPSTVVADAEPARSDREPAVSAEPPVAAPTDDEPLVSRPIEVPADTSSPAEPLDASSDATLPIALGTGGGVLAAGGIALLSAALALDSQLSGAPDGALWPNYADRAAMIPALEISGWVGIGAGAALIVVAVVLATLDPGDSSPVRASRNGLGVEF